MELYENTALCGQDKSHDGMVKWLQCVETGGVKENDLRKLGSLFESLDRKLSIALQSVLPKELEMKVNVAKADQLVSSGRLISGRQVLWHIDRHSRTHVKQDNIVVFDIVQIKWFGDKYKARFLNFWEKGCLKFKGRVPTG